MRWRGFTAAAAVVACCVAGCGTIDLPTLISAIDPSGDNIIIKNCPTVKAQKDRVLAQIGSPQNKKISVQLQQMLAQLEDAPNNAVVSPDVTQGALNDIYRSNTISHIPSNSVLQASLAENSVLQASLAEAYAIPQRFKAQVDVISTDKQLSAFGSRIGALRDALGEIPKEPPPTPIPTPILPLSAGDFYTLATLISKYAVKNPPQDNLGIRLSQYYQTFFSQPFNTYSGQPLSQPTLSMTVTDAEITQSAVLFFEAIFDEGLKSEVWATKAANGTPVKYYPGLGREPSAVKPLKYMTEQTLNFTLSNGCTMNETKARIINYVANKFMTAASTQSALTIRSAGGLSVGLGVFGKLSIGDNNTLSALAKTVVSEIVFRLVTAQTYFILSRIDIDEKGKSDAANAFDKNNTAQPERIKAAPEVAEREVIQSVGGLFVGR